VLGKVPTRRVVVLGQPGSVVTWRRVQVVLLSAQGMDVAAIAKVALPARTGYGMWSATSTLMGRLAISAV